MGQVVGIEAERAQRVAVGSMPSVRIRREVPAHPIPSLRGERKVEVAIEAPHDREGIVHELVVAHIEEPVGRNSCVPPGLHDASEPVRPVARDLVTDLGGVDVIAERAPEDGREAGHRGEHRDRITMRLHDQGVGIDVEEASSSTSRTASTTSGRPPRPAASEAAGAAYPPLTELGDGLGVPGELRRHLTDPTSDYTVSRYPDAANAVPYELYDDITARTKVQNAEEVVAWLRSRIPS